MDLRSKEINLKWKMRIFVIFVLLGCTLFVASSYLSSADQTDEIRQTAQTNGTESIVGERDNITVISADRPVTHKPGLTAFAPNGSVMFFNNTMGHYQDVDPSPAGKYTYMVLISHTPEEEDCGSNVECTVNILQRFNISTGEGQTIYSNKLAEERDMDWHDVDRINDSHYLVSGFALDRVFIVDIESDLIEWQWQVSSDYSYETGGDHPYDWTHMNDVEYIETDAVEPDIMVSLRNQDQVAFLDKKKGLLRNWTLGEEDNYDILFEQHNPDFIPPENGGPAVLVADSQNHRVVEYQRRNESWEETWVWQDSEMAWPRDADRLPNGHTLIADSNAGRTIEVNRTGDIVWSVNWSIPYDVERHGTGPESSGGPSAVRANLTSVAEGSEGKVWESNLRPENPGIIWKSKEFISSLVPERAWTIFVSSIQFVLPNWMSIKGFVILVGGIILALVWAVAELYYSDITVGLRLPVTVDRK